MIVSKNGIRFNIWLWVPLVIASIGMLFLGMRQVYIAHLNSQIEDLMGEIKEQKFPTCSQSLNMVYQWPPGHREGNQKYNEAFGKDVTLKLPEELTRWSWVEYGIEQPYSPETMEALSHYIKQNSEVLNIIEDASKAEYRYLYPQDINVYDIDAEYSRYRSWLACARLLSAASMFYAEKGNSEKSMEYLVMNIELGRAVGVYPTLLGQLNRINMQGNVQFAIKRCISRLDFDDSQLHTLQKQLQKSLGEPILEVALSGELYYSFNEMRKVADKRNVTQKSTAGWWFYRVSGRMQKDHLIFLEHVLQLIQLRELSHSDRLRKISAIRDEKQKLPEWALASEWLKGIANCYKVAAMRDGYLRSMIVALAIKRYNLRYDRYPDSLEELDEDLCPGELLIDLYTDELLQYRLKDTTYQIYSLGLDALDDITHEPKKPHPHSHFLVEVVK